MSDFRPGDLVSEQEASMTVRIAPFGAIVQKLIPFPDFPNSQFRVGLHLLSFLMWTWHESDCMSDSHQIYTEMSNVYTLFM